VGSRPSAGRTRAGGHLLREPAHSLGLARENVAMRRAERPVCEHLLQLQPERHARDLRSGARGIDSRARHPRRQAAPAVERRGPGERDRRLPWRVRGRLLPRFEPRVRHRTGTCQCRLGAAQRLRDHAQRGRVLQDRIDERVFVDSWAGRRHGGGCEHENGRTDAEHDPPLLSWAPAGKDTPGGNRRLRERGSDPEDESRHTRRGGW